MSKERDSETGTPSGNDYFPARYYSPSTSRFLSSDPSGPSFADLTDPERFTQARALQPNPFEALDGIKMRVLAHQRQAMLAANRFATGVTWVDGELCHATSEGNESELRRIDPRIKVPGLIAGRSSKPMGEQKPGVSEETALVRGTRQNDLHLRSTPFS